MLDERNPPPIESIEAYNSVGPINGAMDPPLPAEAYGRPDIEIPPGHMLTPAGVRPCIDGVEDQVAESEPEDEGWHLWEPCLAKHYDPPKQRWPSPPQIMHETSISALGSVKGK